MLLIDEVETDGPCSVASYTVKGDEFFLQGHFPGNPVVPGVILCEMMAQSACLLINGETGFTPYLTGMDRIRVRKTARPGDKIVFKTELLKGKSIFRFIKGEGFIDGDICVSGELSFALVKNEEMVQKDRHV